MLLLTQWVGRHRADIMKIHAPFHARFHHFPRLMASRTRTKDAMVLIEDLPDRACRTRQRVAQFTEHWIFLQVVQDCHRTRRSANLAGGSSGSRGSASRPPARSAQAVASGRDWLTSTC